MVDLKVVTPCEEVWDFRWKRVPKVFEDELGELQDQAYRLLTYEIGFV